MNSLVKTVVFLVVYGSGCASTMQVYKGNETVPFITENIVSVPEFPGVVQSGEPAPSYWDKVVNKVVKITNTFNKASVFSVECDSAMFPFTTVVVPGKTTQSFLMQTKMEHAYDKQCTLDWKQ